MKIKGILSAICVGVSATLFGQASMINTSSDGYLQRGIDMYENQNYTGCIDQLSHLKTMPASKETYEEADFYMAMSRYNCGDINSIGILKNFIAEYPLSFHLPEIWFNIGNSYFFNGKYGEATIAYNNVRQSALPISTKEDIRYRLAYSYLRLGEFDLAKNNLNLLAGSSKYKDASAFYDGYIDYINNDFKAAKTKFEKIDRKGMLGYDAQYYLAQIYFKESDYTKVISLGKALIADKPSEEFAPEINRIVGESEYLMGNDSEAAKYINTYISQNPENTMRTSLYILGVMDFRHGEYKPALENLSKVTEDESDALAQSAYLYIGQSYLKEGNLNNASIAFEKAFNMPFDKNVQETAFYNYAVCQNSGGRTPFNKAIDIFEDFLNKFPDSKYTPDIEEYMANIYMNGNDYERALKSIAHIKNPSSKVLKAKQYVLYKLGIQAVSNDEPQSALTLFKQAKELSSYNPSLGSECDLWIGECLYNTGKYPEAERSLQSFLKNNGTNSVNYYLGNYNLGYALFQQRNYSKSGDAFSKAVSGKSNLDKATTADAYNRIADCLYYDKQFSQAEASYNKAYKTNPASGDYSLFQKGLMIGLQKRHSDKIRQMDELLKEFPESPLASSAMLEKAQAYLALNNNKSAISILEDLIESYPSTTDARKGLLQLAITEKNSGNEERSIASYKKVITKYPASEEAAVAAEDLKIIYAENNDMPSLVKFLNATPNAPKVEINEVDKLTYYAAEKAYMSEKQDITKMREYLKKYPNGAFAVNAQYYTAKYDFSKGKYNDALQGINKVLSKGSDVLFAEDALVMKSQILMKQGNAGEALNSYKELAQTATTNDNRIIANLGILRISHDTGRFGDTAESADILLKSGGLSSEEEKEVLFKRAIAYSNLKKEKEAEKDWAKLAKDTRNIYGAQSAYKLAELYYNNKNYKDAERVLNDFIDDGTPHQYWLARGFILLSDIYKAKGKTFEAKEYLESLKNNYPGNEADIFVMINDRLQSLKKK